MLDEHDAFPRSKSEERVLDHFDDFNNDEDFGDFKLPDLSVSAILGHVVAWTKKDGLQCVLGLEGLTDCTSQLDKYYMLCGGERDDQTCFDMI